MIAALLWLALATPPTCALDVDCVPASCCHARACVPRRQKPDCRGRHCSRHCAPGSIDCGGRCACMLGQCTAVPGAQQREFTWGG